MNPIPPPPPTRRPIRKRARSPYRWLRRFLLLAGIAGIAGLALMLAAYHFGNVDQVQTERSSRIPTEEGIVTSSENIDYVQNSGGKPVFRVRAERSLQDAEGQSRLEDVTLDVYRESGEIYTIKSDRAKLEQDSGEALLEGNVRISGWSDLVLKSRAIEVRQNGRVLISRETVEFNYPPNIIGRASRMRIDKVTDTVTLADGVHIRSTGTLEEEPFRLDSKRLIYVRGEGLIRAVEDVFLRRGGQELSSHFLSIFLREDGRTLKTLRARFKVEGRIKELDDAGGEQVAEMQAQFLEIQPAEANPEFRTVTLEGGEEGPARLRMVQADGLGRTLQGFRLETQGEGGRIGRLQGFGSPLTMVEFLDMPDERHRLRWVCAASLSAGFLPTGEIGQMFLKGRVELRDPQFYASGADEAVVDTSTGSMQLRGPSVGLFTDRGDILSPDIRYNRSTGLIKAQGGVQATFDAEAGTSLEKTPLSATEGPVYIQSREAHWTEVPPGFVFKGDVRAWRGQNLLLAEQMRGDDASREVAASGGVRTVWVPQRAVTVPDPTGFDPTSAAPQAARSDAPIEVSSATMAFRGADNVLAYTGDVVVVQESRKLQCKELLVHMVADTGTADKMICREEVRFVDPVTGKRVSGDRAVFNVAARKVEIFGEEVRLVETAEGNRLVGGYLHYDLDSGETRLSARPPAAAGAGSQ